MRTAILMCTFNLLGAATMAGAADDWMLSTTTPLTSEKLPWLGNGLLGVIVRPEGTGWSSVANHYMEGFWGYNPMVNYLCKIPRWSAITFNDGAADYAAGQGSLSNYVQTLDMSTGIMRTECDWTESGKLTHVAIDLIVSRADPHLAMVRFSVTPQYSGAVHFKAKLDASAYSHLIQSERGYANNELWLSVFSESRSDTMTVAAVPTFEGVAPTVTASQSDRLVAIDAAFTAQSGSTYVMNWFVCLHNNRFTPAAWAVSAKTGAQTAAQAGYASLSSASAAAWHGIWATDITIKGTAPDLAFHQKLIRSNLFQLLQLTRPHAICNVAPTGLSDPSAWDGHVFWDSELWMYPAILAMQPDYAKSMLEYRFSVINGYRQNAAADGHTGAKVAWESAASGTENGGGYGNEIHVSGDVVVACWKQFCYTRDTVWFVTHAYPFIKEVAAYMAGRAVFQNGRYEILGVIPPDEAAGMVNNSVFTNAVFKEALNIAQKAAIMAGETPPALWKTVADGLWLPFDNANQRYIEYQGYSGGPRKQADVELLIYPLELSMSDAVKTNILNYYSSTVSGGPAMTDGVYVVAYAEMGDPAKMYDHYVKCYQDRLTGPYNLITESPGGPWTDFCTGKGNYLQAVINGIGGLRIHDNGVQFKPCLPAGWTELRFNNIRIGSAVYDITVGNGVSAVLKSGIANVNLFDNNGALLSAATELRNAAPAHGPASVISPVRNADGTVRVRIDQHGPYTVDIVTPAGRVVARFRGTGPHDRLLAAGAVCRGMYIMNVAAADGQAMATRFEIP